MLKIIIGSLSMDLLRTALSLHRKSFRTAAVFKRESLERLAELESLELQDPYLIKLTQKIKIVFELNKEDMHEDLLMYSTLFQNFATHKIKV